MQHTQPPIDQNKAHAPAAYLFWLGDRFPDRTRSVHGGEVVVNSRRVGVTVVGVLGFISSHDDGSTSDNLFCERCGEGDGRGWCGPVDSEAVFGRRSCVGR